ncbi:MAG: YceI family protein [Caldilineaceae bacterium]|nr:YceI family protein [Caldilineaceae bacterium]
MKTYRTILIAITAVLTAGLLLAACGRQAADAPAVPAPTAPAEAAATPTVATPTPAPTPDPTAAPETEATAAVEDTETAAASAPAAALDTAPGIAQTETFVIVPEESEARYSINEVFISDNNALVTAIGRTTAITGSLTLNYADPAASTFDEFVVDISLLRSDRSRRDRAIRSRWLESATFPLATFKVTEVRGFPADPAEGESIDFQLVGDMTVKETTREVVWDVTAILEGDRLTGSATLATFLEDFNIPVPSIAGILRVTDGIELTLDFTMEQVEGM